MTDKITLEKALELVSFTKDHEGNWAVNNVYGNVYDYVYGYVGGNVGGYVGGNVYDYVGGNVYGYVGGKVGGYVFGTINGRKWQFIETPKEKLKRLIEEGADKDQLLETFNQLEQQQEDN